MDHSHHDGSHGSPFDFSGMTTKEIIAGGVAGLAEHIGMFPFDTIKTRMQSEAKTFTVVVTGIVRNERWTHLYRGCVPVLWSAVPAHGAYFSIYEATKRKMSTAGEDDSTAGIAVSAAFATVAHDTVSIPFDVVKQRMQVDAAGVHRNSFACFRHVVRSEGVSALFVALPTTTLMNIPHMTTQWLVYEKIKRLLLRRGEEENEMAVHFVLAGLAAGASAACISTPLDNIKTRLQLGMDKSFVAAAKNIYAAHGYRLSGFWTGVVPRICNMAPSAAITLVTYESVKNALRFLD